MCKFYTRKQLFKYIYLLRTKYSIQRLNVFLATFKPIIFTSQVLRRDFMLDIKARVPHADV